MLYIIGLGLNVDGISVYGLEIVKRCKRVYVENYTVDFPYSLGELEKVISKKLISANRELVENLSLIDESQKMDVALLVYGDPLAATTHVTLIQEAKASKVKCKVIHAASIFDAIGETGLQLYKFGKTTSMPAWKKNFTPDSFMEIVQENQSINAHSLILVDIGLDIEDSLEQLEKAARIHKIPLKKIIICQALGTRHRKIFYDKIKNLKDVNVMKPYCIIIPEKLHFLEREVLESF